jgi:hypothetical protein
MTLLCSFFLSFLSPFFQNSITHPFLQNFRLSCELNAGSTMLKHLSTNSANYEKIYAVKFSPSLLFGGETSCPNFAFICRSEGRGTNYDKVCAVKFSPQFPFEKGHNFPTLQT